MNESLFAEIYDILGLKPQSAGEVSAGGQSGEEPLSAFFGGGREDGNFLEDLREGWWRNLCDPAVVVEQDGEGVSLVIRLPEKETTRTLQWELREENGTVHHGEIRPGDLKEQDRSRIGDAWYVALVLRLSLSLDLGYHVLRIRGEEDREDSPASQCLLIVTPPACYVPPALQGEERIWGASCFLDRIRSRRNWGVGDFTDLKNIVSWAAENGAATVSVNSLLSRIPARGETFYPDLPASSVWLDPLYLDPEAVADFSESEEAQTLFHDPAFQVRLANLRDQERVDYQEAAEVKSQMLEILWRHFQLNHLDPETERGWGFRHFQEEGGEHLHLFSLHETLGRHLAAGDERFLPWPSWPPEFQDPASPRVADFAEKHRERLEYHQYVQWQLRQQLEFIGTRSLELGLKVGLAQGLPLGVQAAGFETWQHAGLYVQGTVMHEWGEGEEEGRDFGPPLLPVRLRETGYAPLRRMLSANMRSAGALCLDSIGLLAGQLWRRKNGGSRRELPVQADLEDVLGVIALESHRNRCLIIGEHHRRLDPRFAELFRRKKIFPAWLGHFPRDEKGDWLDPESYEEQIMVAASRGDVTSLSGFWHGHDITLRTELDGDFDQTLHGRWVIARAADRAHLLVALQRQELLPEGHGLDPASIRQMTPSLSRAVHFFLARSAARIILVQLVDLCQGMAGETIETEAPASPSWQQRLPCDFEKIADAEKINDLLRYFRRERGTGIVRPSALLADRRRSTSALIPRAFYRLQFNSGFTFRQAAEIVPYLQELGISHCYSSPYLKARPGSGHGYDIIDHSSLNPEIGSRHDYEEFVRVLDRFGMEQIIDMVPNHMGVGADNMWWLDVLENGPASSYVAFFDINWQPQQEELKNRLLLPILGDHFGAVLEGGQLKLQFKADKGAFFIAYYEHVYPIAPKTYPFILEHDLQRLANRLGNEHEGFLEFQSLIASFANLPGREENDEERITMRNRNKEVLKRLLARLCREVVEIATFIEENLIFFNGEPGRPESFDALDELLSRQPYRLAFWRVASDEINFRRFFDINDLAGLRPENKRVFTETHRFVLDLIATGKVDALRIDHPDGLYDPRGYFTTLQMAVSGVSFEEEEDYRKRMAEEGQDEKLSLYVVVEKILADFETLPDDWLVHGTTGYDFSWLVNGLFVDGTAEREMTEIYEGFVGRKMNFENLLYENKKLIIRTAMAGELNVLAGLLNRLAKMNRYTRDYTLNGLREALIEIVAFFPVYRTYFAEGSLVETGREYVVRAVEKAKSRQQAEDTSIYDFVRSVLLLEEEDGPPCSAALDFVMKVQQYTGPVMAKGLEDTSFYLYNRLVSLNEVGSNPMRFGVSLALFHEKNRERMASWPHSMVNTSTHDSKRSEDVRARINVLSEMCGEWRERVGRWQAMNRRWKINDDGQASPSVNDEYALYQNLLGVWPLEEMDRQGEENLRERFENYMLKVIREAKVKTSWINQNQAYEQAMSDFIGALFREGENDFLADFLPFQRKIAWFGMLNSLGQTVLKLTVPGVPDTYQGNELWHFCLVDPDNRRPVDFQRRREMLAALRETMSVPAGELGERVSALWETADDGRIKLYAIWKALEVRRRHPGLFETGAYVPLACAGESASHICAFARVDGEERVVVAVPRLLVGLLGQEENRLPVGPGVWGDTVISLPANFAGHTFVNILTGEEHVCADNGPRLPAAEVFSRFPAAILALERTQRRGENERDT